MLRDRTRRQITEIYTRKQRSTPAALYLIIVPKPKIYCLLLPLTQFSPIPRHARLSHSFDKNLEHVCFTRRLVVDSPLLSQLFGNYTGLYSGANYILTRLPKLMLTCVTRKSTIARCYTRLTRNCKNCANY